MRWSSSPQRRRARLHHARGARGRKARDGHGGPPELYRRQPRPLGRGIRILVEPASKARTQVFDKVADNALKVKSCDGFNPGDVVELFDGKASALRGDQVLPGQHHRL